MKFETAAPVGVNLSSGSAGRLPTTVMIVSPARVVGVLSGVVLRGLGFGRCVSDSGAVRAGVGVVVVLLRGMGETELGEPVCIGQLRQLERP